MDWWRNHGNPTLDLDAFLLKRGGEEDQTQNLISINVPVLPGNRDRLNRCSTARTVRQGIDERFKLLIATELKPNVCAVARDNTLSRTRPTDVRAI